MKRKTKKGEIVEKYKRYEILHEGTIDAVKEYYEDKIGWDFDLMFSCVRYLKTGEKTTDNLNNYIFKKDLNIFKLYTLSKTTLEKEV